MLMRYVMIREAHAKPKLLESLYHLFRVFLRPFPTFCGPTSLILSCLTHFFASLNLVTSNFISPSPFFSLKPTWCGVCFLPIPTAKIPSTTQPSSDRQTSELFYTRQTLLCIDLHQIPDCHLLQSLIVSLNGHHRS